MLLYGIYLYFARLTDAQYFSSSFRYYHYYCCCYYNIISYFRMCICKCIIIIIPFPHATRQWEAAGYDLNYLHKHDTHIWCRRAYTTTTTVTTPQSCINVYADNSYQVYGMRATRYGEEEKKKQSGDWMCTIYNDDDDRFRLHLVCVSTGCVPGFNGGTFGNKPGIVDWNDWNPVLCFAEIGILWKLPVYIRLDFELILISISPRESYYNFFFDFRVSWYFAIKS